MSTLMLVLGTALTAAVCPKIMQQTVNGEPAKPILSVSFDKIQQIATFNMTVPFLSDAGRYVYQLDFGTNMSFTHSNFDNATVLYNHSVVSGSAPSAEYQCAQTPRGHFSGNKRWDVIVDSCNTISMITTINLNDSSVFQRVLPHKNMALYVSTLHLNKYDTEEKKLLQSAAYETTIEQKLVVGYNMKDVIKLSYFVPQQISDEISIFQSSIDDTNNQINVHMSINDIQIQKVTSNVSDSLRYVKQEISQVCAEQGVEKVFGANLYTVGNNNRIFTLTIQRLDCGQQCASGSVMLMDLYLIENISVIVQQPQVYVPMGVRYQNYTHFKVQLPTTGISVKNTLCDNSPIATLSFELADCRTLSMLYTYQKQEYQYTVSFADNEPSDDSHLYIYKQYDTLNNMSWNSGLLCNQVKESAFIDAKNLYCADNVQICEDMENNTNSSTQPPTNSTTDGNTTNSTNGTTNSTNNNTGNGTGNSTGNQSANSTDDNECSGESCGKDSIEGLGLGVAGVLGLLGIGLLL